MLFKNENGKAQFWNWSEKKDKDYVLEAARERNGRRSGSTDENEIVNLIMSTLEEYPEGIHAKDMDKLAESLGYSVSVEQKIRRALKDAKRIKHFKAGMNGGWMIKKS